MNNNFEIYAVLDVYEAPKKLKSLNNGEELYFYFSPPLPSTIVLFIVSASDMVMKALYNVHMFIDNTLEEKFIGEIGKGKTSLCYNSTWSKEEIDCATDIQTSGRLLKLVVTKTKEAMEDDGFCSQDVNDLIEIDEFNKSLKEFEKECNENQNKIKSLHQSVMSKKSNNSSIKDFFKKKSLKENQKSKEIESVPKLHVLNKENIKEKSHFDPFELPLDSDIKGNNKPPGKLNGKRSCSRYTKLPKFTKKECIEQTVPNDKSPRILKVIEMKSRRSAAKCSDLLHDNGPSGRWGHAFCMINNKKAVVLGGQGLHKQMNADSFWIIDTTTLEWEKEHTDNSSIDRRMGHSVSYDEKVNMLYIYGGSKHKKWYSDVYTLEVSSWKWNKIETIGEAPIRAYHSCTPFYDELLIFGGVFPNPDPTPDGCSNELLIFDKVRKSWYSPIVTGDIPSARSGHSACLIKSNLYIFAGWDAPDCYNDMFVLDVGIMKFTKLSTIGETPTARTWHSTVVLSDKKRFCIHGGFDGKSLSDMFLFDTDTLCWTNISRPDLINRAGHGGLLKSNDNNENETMIVFGGGDNEKDFYDDVVEISVS